MRRIWPRSRYLHKMPWISQSLATRNTGENTKKPMTLTKT